MLTALKKIYFLEKIPQQCKAVCSQTCLFLHGISNWFFISFPTTICCYWDIASEA